MHLITIKTHFATRENEALLSGKKGVDRVVRMRKPTYHQQQGRRGLSMLSPEGQVALFSQKGMFWKKNSKMKGRV